MATDATPRRRAPRMAPEDRRAQLVDVASELFIAGGYAGVTMEDIARAAGVTRPVVYDHFGTREGAYLACVRAARRVFEGELLAGVDATSSIRDRIRAGADAFFAMVEHHPGRWRLLFASNSVLPGEANQELADLRFETIAQVHRLIAPGVDAGVPAARVEAAAHMLSGAAERLGYWWLAHPEVPRAEMLDHLVDLIWGGFAQLETRPR